MANSCWKQNVALTLIALCEEWWQARIAGIIRGAMNRYWKGFEIGGFIESVR